MILTKAQLARFWRDWSAACRHQDWTDKPTQDRERRALLARAGFQSLTHVDRAAGFDRVLAQLGLLRERLDRTAELTDAGAGRGDRRRHLWLIHQDAAPLGGEVYILAVARDRFKVLPALRTLDDLTDDQVYQLMMTIHARLDKARRTGQAASLDSEEEFQDQVAFALEPGFEPETVTADCPF
jgi:hypothetical protein